ncbi:GNAT family N-acetyltransferase [Blastococcus sp. Marseille-P5729]|uniref:GNAT family N-acetyltransferase n=1 Tax=Blastococcus sp. Marseille-P5729 TaxID=2086582 RepID=UPI000D1017A9|nr:GNAT family N-acetyltransferase [Blastococcus sp. Marseille-P5729]
MKASAIDLVRPMTFDDIDRVVKIARRAYDEDITDLQDARGIEPWADPKQMDPAGARITSHDLAEHILATDPDLCLVVEDGGKIRGASMAIDREGTIVMSMSAVPPKHQGQGYALALIERLRSVIDNHMRSLAVVRAAETIRTLFPWNFDVHPSMRAEGEIQRDRLPRLKSVRDGDENDRDLLEFIDRRLRGASRGRDHELLLNGARLFVAEDRSASGYAYAHPNGAPLTVAASTTALARELLFACLASGTPGTPPVVRNITGEQRWAFDVVRLLGMDLHIAGPVIVRGMALPSPYLAHDSLG